MSENLSGLRKRLWRVCSAYIKLRDGRKCYTCGKELVDGKGLHCGHFIPSKACGIDLRYDERNLFVQCYHCNVNLGGFGAVAYRNLVRHRGQWFVDALLSEYEFQLGRRRTWTKKDYLEKIKYYEQKIEELK